MRSSTDSDYWQRRPPTTAEVRTDVLLAVGIFCLAILTLALYRATSFYADPAGPVLSLACLALTTLPLALRRRRPALVAMLVSAGAVLTVELAVPESLIVNISLFLAVYTLGAWGQNRRRANLLRWMIVTAMGIWLLTAFFRATLDPQVADDLGAGGLTPTLASMLIQLVINILYFAAAIWFGNHSWERARTEAELENQAEHLRAERETVASQAVALERMRIARELHDSVAHHVSLMGVQASAARTVLRSDLGQAEAFIRHIEDSARSSLGEMRSLLGILREDATGDSVAQSPSSSLGVEQVEDLVRHAQAVGLVVDYSILGEPSSLRPLVSLCLYRIAQEALTNVRKHAGPNSRARMVLRYLPESVEIEIADDGNGRRRHRNSRDSSPPGAGLGLAGMRERVEALAGHLTTVAGEKTGFTVRAQLPLNPPDIQNSRAQRHLPNSATLESQR